MSKLDMFRDLITQRLTTAALEIFAAVEKSFAEFEEEINHSKEASARLQRLLDIVTQPEIKLHRTDMQQLSVPEPEQIKEEQELWTNLEEEQLKGLQSETTDYTFTSTSVKHDCDQEGFSECLHLDQTVKVENREGDSLPTNTTEEQIKAEPDRQDYAASEPGSDSQPLSVVAPDCPTAQSLEEEHGGELLIRNRTQNNEAPPRYMLRYRRQTLHQCLICYKTFSVKRDLVYHARKHTGKKRYQCQQCKKQFNKSSILVVHMRTHTGEKPFQCQECSKGFSQRQYLIQHTRTHTGEKPFQCQECNKHFTQKGSLVTHMQRHLYAPYKCQECNEKFKWKSQLVVHMRKHTGEKPYQCQECNKMFKLKSQLVLHMRTHTGEKPFQCQECSKRFSKKGNLVVHMMSHTGEKPYQCQECNKMFKLKSYLVMHMRSHTGEKPYQCQECSKAFARSRSLYKHKTTHRRETASVTTM
ncbi:gastrula zinc finger protein XlCGF57.1-like isoform X2 [Hypomesus transpacificus]|uniref:gastrula zinc finger protein XlCGF57.1-like isoform X2 n=1 Tax=Hypomesus transpacificus TaxID=137520 RepID=UPI001F079FED|nr:gastrula zinc finger protein XlCGF57.1-like isoform X2 [Hypomesus transpacificus]